MSCFNPCKKPPQPSRVWSRVQNTCSTNIASTTPNQIFFPLKNKILTIQQVANEIQMIEKGNILQYKKNSSNITKQQKYAQIAKGQWLNRNPTLATQGQNMTDPNTRGFKRVNFKTIYADDGTDAFEPVTCPKPKIIEIPKKLPPRFDRGGPGPPSPPPQPLDPLIGPNSRLNPSYPYNCPQYVQPGDYLGFGPKIEIKEKLPPKPENAWPEYGLPYIDPSNPEKPRDVIPDGGNFICGPDDMCPTTIKVGRNFYKSDHCNPTTASDVPGPVQDLCYNSRKLATFYPRQRRVMTNSGDKFPTGYKFDPELQIQAQECLGIQPEPQPEQGPILLCLTPTSNVNVISSDGNKYVLNGLTYYDSNISYGVYNGTFYLQNIPPQHPMAILNNGKETQISYTGDPTKQGIKDVNGVTYNFYYGDITVTVSGDFDEVSIYCAYHGYMGGENLLKYSTLCEIQPGPPVPLSISSSPETISVPSTSRIYQQTTRSPDSSIAKVGDTVVYAYDDSILLVGATDMFVLLDGNILTEYQITIVAPEPTYGPPVFLPVTSSPETISVTSTSSIYQQTIMSPNSSVIKAGDTVVYAYDDSSLPVGTTDMFVLLDNNILTEYQITIISPPPTYGPHVFLLVTSSPETISVTSTSSIYEQTSMSPSSSVEKVGNTIVYSYDDSVLIEGTLDMFVLLDDNILTEYHITISTPAPEPDPEPEISETVNLNVQESPWVQDMVPTVVIYQQPTVPSSSLTRTFFPAIDASDAYVEIEYTYDPAVLTIGSTDMFILSNDGDLSQYNVTIVEPTPPPPETDSEPEELEPYDSLNEYTANFYSSNEFQWSLGSDWPFSMVQAPVHGTIILVDSDGFVLSDNPATAPATTSVGGTYYLKYIPIDPDYPNYVGGDYVIFRKVDPDNGDIYETRMTINLVNE
jgi:hypothetical protein